MGNVVQCMFRAVPLHELVEPSMRIFGKGEFSVGLDKIRVVLYKNYIRLCVWLIPNQHSQ